MVAEKVEKSATGREIKKRPWSQGRGQKGSVPVSPYTCALKRNSIAATDTSGHDRTLK